MRIALTLMTALAAMGCSTSYAPQNTGRISVVMEGGAVQLYKDGKTYKPGVFGGNIDEAVAGNPRAEREAATYQTYQTTGAIFSFAGLAVELGGVGVLAASAPISSANSAFFPALGLMLGGLAVEIASLAFTMSAQPHLWDAINIYNDGVKAYGVKEPPRTP
jgi:hypothetical protein